MTLNINDIINSMKGAASTGNTFAQFVKDVDLFVRTLEPGDIAKTDPPIVVTAPIAYDLWYLHSHVNFMRNYFVSIDGNHFDYTGYMQKTMAFLSNLPGLKPLRVFRDLSAQMIGTTYYDIFDNKFKTSWSISGIYWIHTMAWEMRTDLGYEFKYSSAGTSLSNESIGYLAFPVGQLGAMEVISLFSETALMGYQFAAVDDLDGYHKKPATLATLKTSEIPVVQNPIAIFPLPMTADKNKCYGRHMVEDAYKRPTTSIEIQNARNSADRTAYAPKASENVEFMASVIVDYGDIRPKMWMRYWIHQDDIVPVPGEFVGILCKPVTVPPHVWWYQESVPLLYSGNWVETPHLTSGIVEQIKSVGDRTDGVLCDQYKVRVQGCSIWVDTMDFYEYSVGDRVAVLKVDSTLTESRTLSWLNMPLMKETDEGAEKATYIIIPATFYKLVH